ncbi:FAD-dependent oxidoreductase [Paenibacillus chitinolyticus]|uniref:FAD-dependent oxidoreductase n=1 Tax=Paenibacillus chitinolyticus TaxID=79263 RepID=UPI0035D74DD0
MRSFAKVMTPYTISSLHGTADRIERIMLAHAGTGASDVTEVDEVVVSHGYDRDFGNLVKWRLERAEYGITVDAKMRTSQPGIFGAGDFITYGSGQALNESSSISSLACCFKKDLRQEATMFSLLAKGIEGLWFGQDSAVCRLLMIVCSFKERKQLSIHFIGTCSKPNQVSP